MPTINSRFLYFLLCVVLITGCNRCKEECDDPTNPECPNYVNPCEGLTEVTAIIEIAEQASTAVYDDIFVPTDIVIDESNVRFRCPVNFASYTWLLGTEEIHDQEFVRYFNGYTGQTISVTLIIQKAPELACFPSDDGLDTLTKTFYVIDRCSPSLEGVYRGAWDDMPMDSFELSLLAAEGFGDPFGACNGFYMSNFSKNNPDSIDISNGGFWNTNYRAYIHSSLASVDSFKGEIYLSENKQTILAEYELYTGDGQYQPHVFRGYRIN